MLELLEKTKYFNSRPHGGRLNWRMASLMYWDFNSRPHGGRLCHRVFHDWQIYFNSRPHGGRRRISGARHTLQTFQLTPSRRATVGYKDLDGLIKFQLTPSRRATKDCDRILQ